MNGINLWELVIIAVIAFVVIGPERLPEYAAKLRHAVREARRLATGAREQLREQMGPEFDDIDWKAYDPRQYDPRRIVREALLEDDGPAPAGEPPSAPTQRSGATAAGDPEADSGAPRRRPPAERRPPRPVPYDPAAPVPFDPEAT